MLTAVLGTGLALGGAAAAAGAADARPAADASFATALAAEGPESSLTPRGRAMGDLIPADQPASADLLPGALDGGPAAAEISPAERPAPSPAIHAPAKHRTAARSVAARAALADRRGAHGARRVAAARRPAYGALLGVAERGLTNAMRMAGSALRVVATAYTSSCYGCSGITASGVHAGFGVIAVDPSIIPLGTRLFIPGYGRAVAGDTGGAIQGHRVDLGFDSQGEALRFGRRPLTIYILR